MLIPSIQVLVEMIHMKGINHVVISPGSRSAPITIAIARHPKITSYIIPDERSACFLALGIAQSTKNTVGVITTSGTAAINLFPAISEAFYRQVPLLIITADRPEEWLEQLDGQTIVQENLFGKYVKKGFLFPTHSSHVNSDWHIQRVVNEAVNLSQEIPSGPIHLNVPIREPFYPELNEQKFNPGSIKLIHKKESDSIISESQWELLQEEWVENRKVIIVGGQNCKDPELTEAIDKFCGYFKVPIIGDITSNLHGIADYEISFHDLFLRKYLNLSASELQPDILVTFGKSILSKSLKQFLRKFKPQVHWHIQSAGYSPDTFQSLSQIIATDPVHFFTTAIKKFKNANVDEKYTNSWLTENSSSKLSSNSYFKNQKFSELEATKIILEGLPDNINLHLSNSMPVRLANILCNLKSEIEIFSNRGTSGIDGCISTAVGTSLVTETLNVLISGDMSFFYDRNGLWHNSLPGNLRIIILNNHGGGIFRIIDGPSKLAELDEYFETHQKLNTKNTARDFEMDYFLCINSSQLKEILPIFLSDDGKSKILEIETNSKANKVIFDQYISQFI